MKVLFADLNESLVKKINKAIDHLPFIRVQTFSGDIFKKRGVIVSASNPDFTMGGGLDAKIGKKYPEECSKARKHPGKNQRIGNVIFTVTVDKELKSNRDFVSKALKFALKSTKQGETVLISGLGTGIGGLDEDDFVWLFLQALCEKFGYGWGIKFTQANGNSYQTHKITNKHVKYTVGKWLEVPEARKDGEECGYGLHLGKDFIGAGNYNLPGKIFFCLFEKKDICGKGDDKIRVRKLLVLAQLPKWLGYGPKGKNIISKVDKKINAEDYNPYQATKLPDTKRA